MAVVWHALLSLLNNGVNTLLVWPKRHHFCINVVLKWLRICQMRQLAVPIHYPYLDASTKEKFTVWVTALDTYCFICDYADEMLRCQ